MEDDKYENSFQIIFFAGNAKSESTEAVNCAKRGKFDEAYKHILIAKKFLNEAHHLQTVMITNEAKGLPIAVNIILIHSQDHLTMGLMAIDNAEQFIELYSELQKVRKD